MRYFITKEFPLRELMKKKKLTIRELSEKSGVHYTFISRLLSEKSCASESIKNKLEDALKKS